MIILQLFLNLYPHKTTQHIVGNRVNHSKTRAQNVTTCRRSQRTATDGAATTSERVDGLTDSVQCAECSADLCLYCTYDILLWPPDLLVGQYWKQGAVTPALRHWLETSEECWQHSVQPFFVLVVCADILDTFTSYKRTALVLVLVSVFGRRNQLVVNLVIVTVHRCMYGWCIFPISPLPFVRLGSNYKNIKL